MHDERPKQPARGTRAQPGLPLILACLAAVSLMATLVAAQAQPAQRQMGTVKSVNADNIVLASDAGAEATIHAGPQTRVVRLEPGQTDLKSAAPAQLSDIQSGDRVLARGQASADGMLAATLIVLMKGADVAQKHEQERMAWQRNGVGGLVKSVDPAGGDIIISAAALPASRAVTVHTTKQTVFRRYAPSSVKFEDAKPSSLAAIKAGDQLRARGAQPLQNGELTADEIVSGSFRNIAGTVISTNAAEQTVTVMDLSTKKPATVKISADSAIRKLPPMMAQMLAARLKGGPAAGAGAGARPAEAAGERPAAADGAARRAGGRGGDLQQMLSRMPAVAISDLQKGDAVMLVATEGADAHDLTAITMLTGVEPILSAGSSQSAASLLTPWSLGGGAPGDEGNPQ